MFISQLITFMEVNKPTYNVVNGGYNVYKPSYHWEAPSCGDVHFLLGVSYSTEAWNHG